MYFFVQVSDWLTSIKLGATVLSAWEEMEDNSKERQREEWLTGKEERKTRKRKNSTHLYMKRFYKARIRTLAEEVLHNHTYTHLI